MPLLHWLGWVLNILHACTEADLKQQSTNSWRKPSCKSLLHLAWLHWRLSACQHWLAVGWYQVTQLLPQCWPAETVPWHLPRPAITACRWQPDWALSTSVADIIVTKPALCFTSIMPRLLIPTDQSYSALASAALACLLPHQSTNCLHCCSEHCSVVVGGPSQVAPATTAVRHASPHPLNFSVTNY